MNLRERKPAQSVDVRGQICPYPIIQTRTALKALAAGEVLEVITDNPPSALETLPSLCEGKGYPFDRVEEPPGVWRVYIQKAE